MKSIHSTHSDYKYFHKYLTTLVEYEKLSKDIILVGPGTSIETFENIDYDNNVVIFVCTELMSRRDFSAQREYMHMSHIIVTGSFHEIPENFKGNVCIIPTYFLWIDFTNQEILNIIKGNVCFSMNDRNGICFIARDDVGKNRRRMLRYFKSKDIHIDCPSKIGNNCPSIESQNMTKIEFLQNYIFNLCPENIYSEGYITEKIFEACFAGCIPLYFGGGLEHIQNIINMDRVILTYKGFRSHIYDDITAALKTFENKEKLEKFFYQPVFCDGAHNEILKLFKKVKEVLGFAYEF